MRKTEHMPYGKPAPIMPQTINRAVTTADPPAFTSFLKLNSRPRRKSSTTIRNWAQNSILSSVVTDGRYVKIRAGKKSRYYITENHRLFKLTPNRRVVT